MSRNGASVISIYTYYLGIIYAKLATKQKLRGVSTLGRNWKHFLQNMFGTPAWPPQPLTQGQDLWMAKDTFL